MKDRITEQDVIAVLQGKKIGLERDWHSLIVRVDDRDLQPTESLLKEGGIFCLTELKQHAWVGSVEHLIRCYGWERSLKLEAIVKSLKTNPAIPGGWNIEFKYGTWYLEWGYLCPELNWEVADRVSESFPIDVKATFDTVIVRRRRYMVVIPHPRVFLPAAIPTDMPDWQIHKMTGEVMEGVELLNNRMPDWRNRINKEELSWADDRVPSTILQQLYAVKSVGGHEIKYLLPVEYKKAGCDGIMDLYVKYGFIPGNGVAEKGRELLRYLWLQHL